MSSQPRPSKADVVSDFRRTQLLAAARDCFARSGVAGTTVDGIARTAGVAKGTVYLYYKSKEEILRQVLDDDLVQFQNDTVPVITANGDVQEKLHRFVVATLLFFDRKRDFFEQVHFEVSPDVRKKARQKMEVVFKAQVESWRATLADAQRAGAVGPCDLPSTALMLVAVATGLAKQRLNGWSSAPMEDIAATTSATLWKGLETR